MGTGLELPYLWLLGNILREPLAYTMGGVIAVISVIGLWCFYVVFARLRQRIFRAFGIVCLLTVPMSLCIDYTVFCYLRDTAAGGINDSMMSSVLSCVSTSIAAIVCFAVDYFTRSKLPKFSAAVLHKKA